MQEFFKAIERNDAAAVRSLIAQDKSLSSAKSKGDWKFEKEVELDAYKFLGAYLGALSGLQLAILLGLDGIAKDIIDASFENDLALTFGGNNTSLHLATFLGEKEIVKLLLERKVEQTKNSKGFLPIDTCDDAQVRKLFER